MTCQLEGPLNLQQQDHSFRILADTENPSCLWPRFVEGETIIEINREKSSVY